ncbi:MAG: DUF3368 domain-containing protein [Candidatus Hydrothermarchaeales archaeon]
MIYLGKVGKLELLKDYDEVFISPTVYEETVSKGIEKGFLDAKIIQKAVDGGMVKLKKLNTEQSKEALELTKFAGIELGEAEAIILAKDLKAELLIDDVVAHGVGRTFGMEPLWTTSYILKLVSKERLTKTGAREIIEKLVEAGYRISEDVLVEVLRRLG